MTETLRRIALVALLVVGSGSLEAQSAPELAFLGFPAGASLAEVSHQTAALGGSLHCSRAKADSHVLECRATMTDSDLEAPVDLWLSAVDSVSSVLTLAGTLDGKQLDRWREALVSRYGPVDAKVQGNQWMMQWVRHGRMLRLTWRLQGNEKLASVSLTDGQVLDSWGRRHERQGPKG